MAGSSVSRTSTAQRAASMSTSGNSASCWEGVLTDQQATPPSSSEAHSQAIGGVPIRRTLSESAMGAMAKIEDSIASSSAEPSPNTRV